MNYKKNQITLQVRVSPKRAKFILDWLYGCGNISREQYQHKLSKIDKIALKQEKEKHKKMEILLKKVFTTKK